MREARKVTDTWNHPHTTIFQMARAFVRRSYVVLYNAIMTDAPPPLPLVSETNYRCAGCGYDISGSALGGACPECGRAVSDSLRMATRSDTCGMVVTVMVLGIVSLVACMPLGVVAIALYPKAKREILEGGYGHSSLTMAKAGLITGIVALAITGLYVLFIGGVMLMGMQK